MINAAPSIALGLIVHPQDHALLPEFLSKHCGFFDATCVVVDRDNATEADLNLTEAIIRDHFKGRAGKLHLAVHSLGRDFAAQRNRCAAMNPCDWLLMLDADESLRVRSMKLLRPALGKLLESHPRARVLGLTRDNSIDGKTLKTGQDWQYRLVRRGVSWRNTEPRLDASPGCHEMPREVHDEQDVVMALEHLVILHEKTLARQRAQNRFYEACA